MGCLQKVFDVEIDLELLEAAESERAGFGAVRARRAAADVRGRGDLVLREPRGRARLPEPGVPRAPARARELPRLRPRQRRELALSARRLRSLSRRLPSRCSLRSSSMSPVESPPFGHVSRTAGEASNAGCPRKVASPFPISLRRRPRAGRGSRRAARRRRSRAGSGSARCRPGVELVERLVERVGGRDVHAGRPPVARVDAHAQSAVSVERVVERGELVD